MSHSGDRHRAAQAAWDDDEPEPRQLTFGSWALELRGDEVADITFDGSPVLRGVKAVIRNQDWETVPSRAVSLATTETGFDIDLAFAGVGGDFDGRLTATATGDALDIAIELRALAPFERNRAGLVALIPASAAGSPLRVGHSDGTTDDTTLPTAISPHQPAFDIDSLAWTHEGVRVQLALRGETFELEDQRNWSDASFKIYSTPLSLPFPVSLEAGAEVAQGLRLQASRIAPRPTAARASIIDLRSAAGTFPAIGTSASTGPDPTPPDQIGPTDNPVTILVELDLATANWRLALARAVTEASGAPLDLRLVIDDPAAIAAALAELAPLKPIRLGVTDARSHVTTEALWRALQQAAAASQLSAELVGGTRAHFTELNRIRDQLPADLPALTFSSTPQMHARERAGLVESILIQRLIAQGAVRIAAGRPVHVGPITLRPRFNAVATTLAPAEPPHLAGGYGAAHLDSATDSRQGSTALSAWTIASAAAFAIPGVASLSFFEACGPRGIAGYPVAQAFSWLRELQGHPLLEPTVAPPPGVWMVGAQLPAGPTLLMANLNSISVEVTVRFDGRSAVVEVGPLTARRVALPLRGKTVTSSMRAA
jgi:D-apionolactonase